MMAGASFSSMSPAVAAGGSLYWFPPQASLQLEGSQEIHWSSNLVMSGGKEYWVLYLDYNPTGSLTGGWVHVPVVPDNTGALSSLGVETANPSVAIVGDTIYVAFEDASQGPGAADVYLASLPQAGGTPSWQIQDITGVASSPGYTGAGGDAPSLATDGQTLSMAWDTNGALEFLANVASAPLQTVFTPPDDFYSNLRLAEGQGAQSGLHVASLYAGPTDSPGNYGATDLGGCWSQEQLGGEAPGGSYDHPDPAIGACGPAVAYDLRPQAPTPTTSRCTWPPTPRDSGTPRKWVPPRTTLSSFRDLR